MSMSTLKKLKSESGRERDTKLLEAARKGRRDEMVNILKKGANINIQDDQYGYTSLHIVCLAGFFEGLQCLLVNGVDCSVKTMKYQSALHLAAAGGYMKLVTSLLKEYNANINDKDANGFTPLHLAMSARSSETVAALLDVDGVDLTVKDNAGKTALHMAAEASMAKETDKLCRLGADPSARDQSGQTPLHRAAFVGASGCITALLGHNVNVAQEDNAKKTAADVADEAGHSVVAGVLRKAKATDNTASDTSMSLIGGAADGGSMSHLKLPTDLPPPPDEIPENFDGSIGLAPPDVTTPAPYRPTASQLSNISADDVTSLADEDEEDLSEESSYSALTPTSAGRQDSRMTHSLVQLPAAEDLPGKSPSSTPSTTPRLPPPLPSESPVPSPRSTSSSHTSLPTIPAALPGPIAAPPAFTPTSSLSQPRLPSALPAAHPGLPPPPSVAPSNLPPPMSSSLGAFPPPPPATHGNEPPRRYYSHTLLEPLFPLFLPNLFLFAHGLSMLSCLHMGCRCFLLLRSQPNSLFFSSLGTEP